MDRPALGVGRDRLAGVERLAEHVEDPPEGAGADRDGDRRARVLGRRAALQPVGRVEGEAAHPVVAEVLLDLGDEGLGLAVAAHGDVHRVEDRG